MVKVTARSNEIDCMHMQPKEFNTAVIWVYSTTPCKPLDHPKPFRGAAACRVSPKGSSSGIFSSSAFAMVEETVGDTTGSSTTSLRTSSPKLRCWREDREDQGAEVGSEWGVEGIGKVSLTIRD